MIGCYYYVTFFVLNFNFFCNSEQISVSKHSSDNENNYDERDSLSAQGITAGAVTNYTLTDLAANGFVLCSSMGMNTLLTAAELNMCKNPGGW